MTQKETERTNRHKEQQARDLKKVLSLLNFRKLQPVQLLQVHALRSHPRASSSPVNINKQAFHIHLFFETKRRKGKMQ